MRSHLRRFAFTAAIVLSGVAALAQTPPAASSVGQIRLAAELVVKGDLDGAELQLKNILSLEPENYRALNLLGVIRAQQQRRDEAEKLFKQAISSNSKFAGAHVNLGMLYGERGLTEQAEAELKQALELEPGRPDATSAWVRLRRSQAADALQKRELERALSLLLDARKSVPDDADLNYELGMVELQMSLFADSEQAFRKVLATRSDDPKAIYGLGRSQMALTKFQDARVTFEKYLKLRPDDASGHYALGLVLSALEEPAEARRHFQRSVEIKPVQTESYVQLGKLDLDQGQLESAAADFDIVLKRDPAHAVALLGMGQVEFQRKQYAQARDFLTRSIASDQSSHRAHYYLGLTLARLGLKDEANREMEEASRLEREQLDRQRTLLKVLDPAQVSENPK